jgi:outer membrane protein assembly factor BamB
MTSAWLLLLVPAVPQDWPAWRHDAARSAASPHELPAVLRHDWTLRLPARTPAWPDQPRMQVDAVYEPVAAGRTLVIPSVEIDGLVAYDTRSGEERWRFWTDGPVRLPAAISGGTVFAASDDGHLYAVDLESGRLRWRFRGGPSDRRILGNERLISTWPARGAPVVHDGTVYFAAGIWPFMGIFLHALDAETGRAVWTQDGDGSMFIQQPHRADSFGGVAPQGPLAVFGDRLLVPGGRSVPAVYDRASGALVHFKLADQGRRGGMETAVSPDGLLFTGGAACDLETGAFVGEYARALVLTPGRYFHAGKKQDLIAAEAPLLTEAMAPDRKGVVVKQRKWKAGSSSSAECPPVLCLIAAGTRLYAGVEGGVRIFSLGAKPRLLGEFRVDGTPASLIAADGRLVIVTREGTIQAFGAMGNPAARLPAGAPPAPPRTGGYEFLYSAAPVRDLFDRIASSSAHVIAVHPDAAAAAELRTRLAEAGLYGRAGAVLQGDPLSAPPPPYVATGIDWAPGPAPDPAAAARLFDGLRPFGGALTIRGASRADLARLAAGLEGAETGEVDGVPTLLRTGPLKGSADWTHEHADASNTRVSKDARVRAPLGLLWFGGPSHEGILPRHGHGPQPQVLDGRLFIEGVDLMRAIDVYTGRLLWETRLPGVGDFFNNTLHQPGANASGSNFVSTREGLYVAWKDRCVKLDPAGGAILREYPLPDGEKDWSFLSHAEGVLIGASRPLQESGLERLTEGGDDDPSGAKDKESSAAQLINKLKALAKDNDDRSSSRRLFAIDPASGRLLWSREARAGFRHNSICAGGGRLYLIDRVSGPQAKRMKQRGVTQPPAPELLALDLKTGGPLWSVRLDVFGTWLGYSAERDLLVETGRVARDGVPDEPKGMIVRKAADGTVVWKNSSYAGPAMIHHDTILMADRACDLRTGELRGRIDPVTLQPSAWTWARTYGCNTPMASEHLLTFRSGAAGFFDLAGDGGTGNLGGFKSGCTNNLVVAGGVLCAPDYTRTCTCSYQNQTSLGLLPMPENELWTFFGTTAFKGPLLRLGVNFGAPGDRRAPDGTLWLEYPDVGGKSPDAPVKGLGEEVGYFRRHPSAVSSGSGPAWVASSGAMNLRELVLELDPEGKGVRDYSLRLHFVEPEGKAPGERVFDVRVQGRTLLEGVDPAREAGGAWISLVKDLGTVSAGKELRIAFVPRRGEPLLCGLELRPPGGDDPDVVASSRPAGLVVAPDLFEEPLGPAKAEEPPFRWSPGIDAFLRVMLGALLFLQIFVRWPFRRPA